jgi:hypothetical protein
MFHEMLIDQMNPIGISTHHDSRGKARKHKKANCAIAASTGMAS